MLIELEFVLLHENIASGPDGLNLNLDKRIILKSCNKVDSTVVYFRGIDLKSVHRKFHFHEVLGIRSNLLTI